MKNKLLLMFFSALLFLNLNCIHAEELVDDSYKITFDSNNGIGLMEVITCNQNQKCMLTQNTFSKHNSIFSHWNTKSDNSGTSYKNQEEVTLNEDTTLYAIWGVKKYNILFNSNGGKGKIKTIKNVKFGKNITLPKNKFKKKGYKFIGWNTKKDGTGTSYKNKDVVSNLSINGKTSVTLYAMWQKIKYNITYKLNGGTNNEKNALSYDITTSIKLENPTKEHYQFVGWFKDKKLKKKITNIKKGSTGNKTIYAKWKPYTYSIKFNSNGGKGKTKTIKCKYGKNCKLSTNGFKKYESKFLYWNTKKDGSGTSYKNKEKVKNLVSTNKGTITLYAIWKEKTYKITYELNGGINNPLNPTTFKRKDLVWLEDPTREGYTFGGWYANSKFSGQRFFGFTDVDGNVKFYAKWVDDAPKDYNEYKEIATKIVENNWEELIKSTTYINDIRKKEGSNEVILDKDLSIYATVKAMEMYYKGYFTHSSKEGLPFGYLNNELQIISNGENLLQGSFSGKQAIDLWCGDAGHYGNIINPGFTKFGMGYYDNFWVQEFSY